MAAAQPLVGPADFRQGTVVCKEDVEEHLEGLQEESLEELQAGRREGLLEELQGQCRQEAQEVLEEVQ